MPVPGRKKQADQEAGRKKRRGRGEGAIYFKEEKGLWCTQISLGYDGQGRRRRRTIYDKTKTGLQAKLRKLYSDMEAGLPVEPSKLTVAQHLHDWLRRKKPNVKSGTYAKYRYHTKLIEAHLGGVRLRDLDHRMVASFYEALDEADLSDRYVYEVAARLRQVLHDAVDLGLIPKNPASKVKRSFEKKEARFLTQEELARFLEAAKGEPLENAFLLALHTGLRPGEWLGLSWDAVELETAKLHVRQALHEEEGKVFLGSLKTKAARRTISLTPTAVQALRRQRVRQNEARLKAGAQWSNDANLVFTGDTGGMLRRSNIYDRDLGRVVKRAREKLKKDLIAAGKTKADAEREAASFLKGVTLHSFRHTHAAALIFQGEDPKTIQRRLGHESIEITLDLYGHLMPGKDERAAERMEAFMASLSIGST